MLVSAVQAIAGVVILAFTAAFGDFVSLGTLLGILLLVSAAARYALARTQTRA